MKIIKNIFLSINCLFFPVFLLVSCLSVPSTSINTTGNTQRTASSVFQQPIRWTVHEEVNEWGDKLGKFYIQYDGSVNTSLITSQWTDNFRISEIVYSNDNGFSFRTSSYTGAVPLMDSEVTVIIRNADGNEISFKGIWRTYPSYIQISSSNDLIEALSTNNIIIRVSVIDGSRRFQFTFPPNFQLAYERLLARENSSN